METNDQFGGGVETHDRVQSTRVVSIYEIIHTESGKRYIGKSVDPKRRWQQHKRAAYKGDQRRLYASIRKYGVEAFQFNVLSWHVDDESAYAEELRLVSEGNLCDPEHGFNLTYGGRGGCQLSDEARCKLSNRMRENNPFKGKHHSEETRALISRSLSGEKNPNFGQKKSDEVRKRMSDSQKGRKLTDEHREKLRLAKLSEDYPHRGRKRSEETKRRMREAWQRRKTQCV